MQVATACPHCSGRFQVSKAVIGKRTRCTKCGEPFVLAESPATPVATEKPAVKRPAGKADSFDFDFDGPTQARNDTAHAPPVPASPPEFRNLNTSNSAIVTDGEDRWQRMPSTVSREYRALRFIARTLEFVAVFLAVLLVIAIAIQSYEYSEKINPTTQDLTRLWTDIFQMCLGMGAGNLFLLFISNSIRLGIQIERNTYTSQEWLEGISAQTTALLQLQQNPEREVLREKPAE